MTEQCCPTCGGALRNQFSWSLEKRLFITPDARIKFAGTQAAIFDAIWTSGNGIHNTEQFMQAVYGSNPHGGPDGFNAISAALSYMRQNMKPTGYTITKNVGNPRQGWRLVKVAA